MLTHRYLEYEKGEFKSWHEYTRMECIVAIGCNISLELREISQRPVSDAHCTLTERQTMGDILGSKSNICGDNNIVQRALNLSNSIDSHLLG